MYLEMKITGSSQTMTTTFETDAKSDANSNVYVLTFQAHQPLTVKQLDENTVQLEVVGDWEIADLLQTMTCLGKADAHSTLARVFRHNREPEQANVSANVPDIFGLGNI